MCLVENDWSLPRNRRLHRQAEYQSVFRDPSKHSTRYFTVLYRRNGMPHARLGLAVSKKNVRRSVDRNRLKRFIRESFRLHQRELGPFDVVVLVKSGVLTAPRKTLYEKQQEMWTPLIRR